MPDTPSPRLLRAVEAAQLIGCTPSHVYHLIRTGKLEAVKDKQGRLRVSETTLDSVRPRPSFRPQNAIGELENKINALRVRLLDVEIRSLDQMSLLRQWARGNRERAQELEDMLFGVSVPVDPIDWRTLTVDNMPRNINASQNDGQPATSPAPPISEK